MLGRKERDQLELFISGSLRQLIPDEYVLVRVDGVLDLSWLRNDLSDLYCLDNGRPGIDPEVAVRLMLAGFLLGIVHDRRLMREAAVNIAIRWFVGYGLHEPLPDHSSLTRIRQRWGAERFRRIFERTVRACIAARIATGEVVHLDASLIRAHVSWDALVVRHVEAVAEANSDDDALSESRQSGKFKKVCVTDPDATMATNGRNRRLEPAYKQHTAVDDIAGVIVDVEVATGEENEGMAVAERLDAVAMAAGRAMTIATMDAGYAYAKVFRALEDRQIEGIVPAKAEPPQARSFPRDGSNSMRCIIWPAARVARFCAPRANSSAGRSSIFTPVPESAALAHYGRAVSAPRAMPVSSSSMSTTRLCCGLDASGSNGEGGRNASINVTAGASRASTARPRPGTVLRAPFGGASTTCASRLS